MAEQEPKYDFSMFGDKPKQAQPQQGYDFSMFEDVKKKRRTGIRLRGLINSIRNFFNYEIKFEFRIIKPTR